MAQGLDHDDGVLTAVRGKFGKTEAQRPLIGHAVDTALVARRRYLGPYVRAQPDAAFAPLEGTTAPE